MNRNWFQNWQTSVAPGPQHVLVRLPSNHVIWLPEEHYQLIDQNYHALVWMKDGSIEVVPCENVGLYDPTDILLWTTEIELQSPEAVVIGDGWPYNAIEIRMMNQHQMRHPTNKKRDTDVHVPYDPRLGF